MSHIVPSELASLCAAKGFYTGKDGHFTHISMDGFKFGRINVPKENLEDFYDKMVKDYSKGRVHYLTERITSTDEEFRFYADFDFVDHVNVRMPQGEHENDNDDGDDDAGGVEEGGGGGGGGGEGVGEERQPGTDTAQAQRDMVEKDQPLTSLQLALKPYSKKKMRAIIKVIVTEMRRFYPEDFDESSLTTIVARAPVMVCGENRVKHAFHIHQPFHIVDLDRVMNFRKAIIEALRLKFGERRPGIEGNPWTDVFDSNVYGFKMGLRMLFNRKFGKCPHCNGKGSTAAEKMCEMCANVKKMSLGREYVPWIALAYDGSDDHFLVHEKKILNPKTDTTRYSALVYCTFRRSNANCEPKNKHFTLPSDFKPYEGAPRVNVDEARRKGVANGRLPPAARTPIDVNGDVAQMALNVVRSLAPQYANLTIDKFVKAEKQERCFMKVRGDGQHYCQNIKGCHNSSTVYFMFTPSGVCQKCFCRKEEIKEGAPRLCKHFESRFTPLPRELERFLFTSLRNISKVDFKYNKREVDDGGDDFDPDAVEKFRRKMAAIRANAYDDDDLHSQGRVGDFDANTDADVNNNAFNYDDDNNNDDDDDIVARAPPPSPSPQRKNATSMSSSAPKHKKPKVVVVDPDADPSTVGLPPRKKRKIIADKFAFEKPSEVDEDYLATVYEANVSGMANLEAYVKGKASNLEPAIAKHHGAPSKPYQQMRK